MPNGRTIRRGHTTAAGHRQQESHTAIKLLERQRLKIARKICGEKARTYGDVRCRNPRCRPPTDNQDTEFEVRQRATMRRKHDQEYSILNSLGGKATTKETCDDLSFGHHT
ncbi:hypothetical protein [Chelativorans intermedius]|uniref:Uncharacterized protein n=1 Tax=Chelativorans intermedius TaxID=515947 RepID=A0ABV6DAM2_9HYPH|nr:hypothetical protein [Chelativorans intermedius]MCT9000140.1 hypothetical protein [Chelativorans intermedius]